MRACTQDGAWSSIGIGVVSKKCFSGTINDNQVTSVTQIVTFVTLALPW